MFPSTRSSLASAILRHVFPLILVGMILTVVGRSAWADSPPAEDAPTAAPVADVSASTSCPSPSDLVRRINGFLDEALLDEAISAAGEVEAILACQPEPVSSLVLTPLFHLVGATYLFMGDQEAADAAFAWSVAVSPTSSVDAMLGQRVQEAHESIRAAMLAETGSTIRIDGDVEIWMDGRAIEPGVPIELVGGPHLLQWRMPGEDLHSQVLQIIPGEGRAMSLGGDGALASGSRSKGGLSDTLSERRKVLLLGGAGTMVVGGTLLLLANQAHAAFYQETDPQQLAGLQARTNGLAMAGMGFTVIGGAVLGATIVAVPTASGAGLGVVWRR